jgi:hypothetical protein
VGVDAMLAVEGEHTHRKPFHSEANVEYSDAGDCTDAPPRRPRGEAGDVEVVARIRIVGM